MKSTFFPPRDAPLPLSLFSSSNAKTMTKFNPIPIDSLFKKYAAGLRTKPSAEQLRTWMNNEVSIPPEYHTAIRDVMANMTGEDCMRFRQNSGSSIRGMVHLIHETGSFTDRVVHYVDQYSDIGDQRERWDKGYAGIEIGR